MFRQVRSLRTKHFSHNRLNSNKQNLFRKGPFGKIKNNLIRSSSHLNENKTNFRKGVLIEIIRNHRKLIDRPATLIDKPAILITKRYYSIKINDVTKTDIISKDNTPKVDGLLKFVNLIKDNKVNKSESKSIVIDDLSPLQRYCKLVGTTTGKFLGITALTGAATVGSVAAFANVVPLTIAPYVCIGGILCSFIGSLYHAYHIDSSKSDEERLRHAYWMHAFLGVVISPVLVIFSEFIPHALITTAALVAGPITFSRFMPKGSLLPWGTALYTALWGLIGVGCMSLIAPLLGFTNLAMTLHGIDLYAGVALFTLYNAYDTHKLINDFENGRENHIGHAAHYSLNAINIFIRLLEIFAKANKGNKH